MFNNDDYNPENIGNIFGPNYSGEKNSSNNSQEDDSWDMSGVSDPGWFAITSIAENNGASESTETVSDGAGAGNKAAGVSNGEEYEQDYNQTVANASRLIPSLNGAAMQLGIPSVIEGIKNFDPTQSDNPIPDLLRLMGIDTKAEIKELHENQAAGAKNVAAYYAGANAPQNLRRSKEGDIKAIQDMKKLIYDVERADNDYFELREAAKHNNRNIFEQAVVDYQVRDLASLLSSLNDIKSSKNAERRKFVSNEKIEDGKTTETADEEVQVDKDDEEDEKEKLEKLYTDPTSNPDDIEKIEKKIA